MIYIVTGKINSGKTTKLLSIYNEKKIGDGFILPKVYIDGNYAGQRIVRLSTGDSIPFSFREEYIPESWNEKSRYDVYSFSREGFKFAQEIASQLVNENISPAFLDEIGPLELKEEGFFQALSLLINTNSDIYFSVRIHCLEDILQKFDIRNYETINV